MNPQLRAEIRVMVKAEMRAIKYGEKKMKMALRKLNILYALARGPNARSDEEIHRILIQVLPVVEQLLLGSGLFPSSSTELVRYSKEARNHFQRSLRAIPGESRAKPEYAKGLRSLHLLYRRTQQISGRKR